MYKVIAMDLDGSLLNDDKQISQENLELIDQLISKGYEIVIATGRRYWSAKQLVKPIGKPLIILANNGNMVRETANDGIIIRKYLNLEDFKLLIREGKKRGLHPIVHVDNYDEGYDIIIEMEKEYMDYSSYLNQSKGRYKEVNSYLELVEGRILAVVYMGSKEKMRHFYLDIIKRFPDKYNTHVMENIQAAEALLEIMDPVGCKWLSLMEYARQKGIDQSEIIAIGDDNNDIEMIKNAGCGIAMKNASEGAKQVADIITENDNNASGVALELKKILVI